MEVFQLYFSTVEKGSPLLLDSFTYLTKLSETVFMSYGYFTVYALNTVITHLPGMISEIVGI